MAVCGPGDCTSQEAMRARRVGELLADRGAVVICGGGGGVMAAVAAGNPVPGIDHVASPEEAVRLALSRL